MNVFVIPHHTVPFSSETEVQIHHGHYCLPRERFQVYVTSHQEIGLVRPQNAQRSAVILVIPDEKFIRKIKPLLLTVHLQHLEALKPIQKHMANTTQHLTDRRIQQLQDA